jgi:hypothetical protein
MKKKQKKKLEKIPGTKLVQQHFYLFLLFKSFLKKFKFFLNINFIVFSNYFDVLILKIIFKK